MDDQLPLFDVGTRQPNGKSKQPSLRSVVEHLRALHHRIVELEKVSDQILAIVSSQQTQKEAYTTAEVAEILGKRPYTVREWARLGRIDAYKVPGRGAESAWRVTHEELIRIQNEGLLPIPDSYAHPR